MFEYDYSSLRGRIVEILGSNKKYAEALDISERSLSLKLNNKVRFTQNEIMKSCDILHLEELKPYFFKLKVHIREQVAER